mmetsp:Transcript_7145/g.17153  ORF Transcript_7145/g.17153 Transcript_7145/m.17153 type:complete len:143 (+) Transcript_7145:180-608(+)
MSSAADAEQQLQEPLLLQVAEEEHSTATRVVHNKESSGQAELYQHAPASSGEVPVSDSLVSPVLNLSCTIIGSGIIALPKSFQVLGMILGGAVVLSVALLSYFSIGGLIRCQALVCEQCLFQFVLSDVVEMFHLLFLPSVSV